MVLNPHVKTIPTCYWNVREAKDPSSMSCLYSSVAPAHWSLFKKDTHIDNLNDAIIFNNEAEGPNNALPMRLPKSSNSSLKFIFIMSDAIIVRGDGTEDIYRIDQEQVPGLFFISDLVMTQVGANSSHEELIEKSVRLPLRLVNVQSLNKNLYHRIATNGGKNKGRLKQGDLEAAFMETKPVDLTLRTFKHIPGNFNLKKMELPDQIKVDLDGYSKCLVIE